MGNLYNTVLITYTEHFSELPFKYQFHLASRLHLWQSLPQAKVWLDQLRPQFTASDNPLAALEQLKSAETAGLAGRGNFELHLLERLLFRALFLETIYGLPGRAAFIKLIPAGQLESLRGRLLTHPAELVASSSTSVNFLYLLDRFIRGEQNSLANLPDLTEKFLNLSGASGLKHYCYYLTHCVLGESLFYSKPINTDRQKNFRQHFAKLEPKLIKEKNKLTLDCQLEFLVCCRLIGYKPRLKIMDPALENGFITEPLRLDQQTLEKSEHRNVLFLMSQANPASSAPA